MREQRARHRIERSDQRVELISFGRRVKTGIPQREIFRAFCQRLYRPDQMPRQINTGNDRRQNREQDDGTE